MEAGDPDGLPASTGARSPDQATYLIDDLDHDDRWPHLAGLTRAELPATYILSFRLFTSDDAIGTAGRARN